MTQLQAVQLHRAIGFTEAKQQWHGVVKDCNIKRQSVKYAKIVCEVGETPTGLQILKSYRYAFSFIKCISLTNDIVCQRKEKQQKRVKPFFSY